MSDDRPVINFYGTRRCGTNYVHKLLEENFKVRIHIDTHKHTIPRFTPCVMVTRNPYAYALSAIKYFDWEAPDSWMAQLLAEVWVWQARAYYVFAKAHDESCLIQWEYMLDQHTRENILAGIQGVLHLEPRHKDYVNVELDKKFDKDFYKEERFMNKLTTSFKRAFTMRLRDWPGQDVMRALNYELWEP